MRSAAGTTPNDDASVPALASPPIGSGRLHLPVASVRAWVAVALLALVVLLGLGAGSARAAFFVDAPDPAGDASSADPSHDLLGAGVGYDRRTGQLVGAVKLGGAPGEAPAFVTIVATTRTATGCEGPAVGFGSFTDEVEVDWYRFADPSAITARGEADKDGYASAVQTFEVTERALRGLRPDCVLVTLTEPGNAQNVYDTAGPLRLAPLPSLSLRLGGLPERAPTGRSHRLKITVGNPGDAPTGRVSVRLAREHGTRFSPRALTLRSIAPGKRRTATVMVRFDERASVIPDLRVTATAGRLRLEEEISTYVPAPDEPDRGSGGGGGGGEGTPGVCTRWIPDFSGETGGSLGLVPCQV